MLYMVIFSRVTPLKSDLITEPPERMFGDNQINLKIQTDLGNAAVMVELTQNLSGDGNSEKLISIIQVQTITLFLW